MKRLQKLVVNTAKKKDFYRPNKPEKNTKERCPKIDECIWWCISRSWHYHILLLLFFMQLFFLTSADSNFPINFSRFHSSYFSFVVGHYGKNSAFISVEQMLADTKKRSTEKENYFDLFMQNMLRLTFFLPVPYLFSCLSSPL